MGQEATTNSIQNEDITISSAGKITGASTAFNKNAKIVEADLLSF